MLSTRVSCLLANGRFHETSAAADEAWPLQAHAEGQVMVAAMAWVAASYTEPTQAAPWAARLAGAYQNLPDGARPLPVHLGRLQALAWRPFSSAAHSMMSTRTTVRLFSLLVEPKTPAAAARLDALLAGSRAR